MEHSVSRKKEQGEFELNSRKKKQTGAKEERREVVSTILPPFELLNIVDQRSVIPLRELAEQEEEKTEIQRPQARVLVPWHGLVVERRSGLEGAAICGALFCFPQHCIYQCSSSEKELMLL